MTTSRSVVFFGTEAFSAPALQALIAAGYPIAYVVTKPDTPRGRGRKLESPEVKKIAEAHGIPVLQPAKLADIQTELEALVHPVGVLAAYGKILPQRTLDVFEPTGIINIHPSLLPQYRGPSPIEAAILDGLTETGISLIKLTAGMDEGPIFAQVTVALTGRETKPELSEHLAQKGAELLVTHLPRIISGGLQPTPQSDNASYTSLLSKDIGRIDPIRDTAELAARKVRAYLGYPKTRLPLGEHEIIVMQATPTTGADLSPLVIRCADATYLRIDELIAPSGKKMNAEAFIRGYRS